MWERFKIPPGTREIVMRILVIAVTVCIALLTFDVFSDDRDGRRQIIDEDGGIETALCAILSDIKGAGDVDVMIKYDGDNQVTGVIVTASGAGSVIVRSNLANAVSAVFNIPMSNVMVFEKENGGNSE